MNGIPIFNRGFLGVDLFFLLSGLILTHGYSQRLTTWSFFSARIARTYPLHLFMILLLPAFGRGEVYSAGALFCNLTMTQVVCGGPLSWNGVSWSLSAEWAAYLLFPFLLGPLLTCPRWMAGILVLCCAGILVSISPIGALDSYGAGALARSLPEFLTGTILYRAFKDRWLAHWGWFVGSVVAMAAAFAMRLPDILILSTFAAMILSCPYVKAMEHQCLAFLGDISYSLYMGHQLVGFSIATAMLAIGVRNGPVMALTATALSVLFATVTYRCIELPGRAGLRRWMALRRVGAGVA
jgi:peptidoglycan/LPS O-acetylase OafA/YrhL